MCQSQLINYWVSEGQTLFCYEEAFLLKKQRIFVHQIFNMHCLKISKFSLYILLNFFAKCKYVCQCKHPSIRKRRKNPLNLNVCLHSTPGISYVHAFNLSKIFSHSLKETWHILRGKQDKLHTHYTHTHIHACRSCTGLP